MIDTHWYIATVLLLLVLMSIWATFANTPQAKFAERTQYFAHTFAACVTSVIAYWVLVFILVLVIAAALWLILLLLIWVPSDFLQNYFGSDLLSRALHNIKPIIYRSAHSPGLTAIPLLDYLSLYAAHILGPWFGVWSILSQREQEDSSSSAPLR